MERDGLGPSWFGGKDPLPHSIDDLLHQLQDKFHEALEQMCERSLTDPAARGVLVTHHPGFSWRMELSSAVPYGTVHERHLPAQVSQDGSWG